MKMSHCFAAIAGLALFFSANVSAADVGYVQIKSESGLQVLLDGKFQGVTKEDVGGMILTDVAIGTHTLKVLKANFNPQEKNIQLTKDQIYVWEIKSLTPGTQISEEGKTDAGDLSRQVGNLVIQSVPVEATVEIPKLQTEPFAKSKETWKADAIPAGEYQVKVAALGKSATCRCKIEPGKTTRLLANILQQRIRNLTEEEEAERLALAAQEARRQAEARAAEEAARTQKELSDRTELQISVSVGVNSCTGPNLAVDTEFTAAGRWQRGPDYRYGKGWAFSNPNIQSFKTQPEKGISFKVQASGYTPLGANRLWKSTATKSWEDSAQASVDVVFGHRTTVYVSVRNNKISISHVVEGLNAPAQPRDTSNPTEVNIGDFSPWLDASAYQSLFEKKRDEGLFPIRVEGKSGTSGNVFRAGFSSANNRCGGLGDNSRDTGARFCPKRRGVSQSRLSDSMEAGFHGL